MSEPNVNDLEVTSAEDYGRLESPTDEIAVVPMPSGARFKMRRADIQGMAQVGMLPQSLVNMGLTAWRKQGKADPESMAKEAEQSILEQSPEDSIELLIFYRQIVVDNVLQPRIGYSESGIVSLLNGAGKPIAPLQTQDFRYAFKWITRQEGKEAAGLSKFREGREGGTVAASADGTGLGSESVIPVESTQ